MNDLLNRKMISVLKGLELFVQHNTELSCTAADKYHVMHDNLISRELSILKAKRCLVKLLRVFSYKKHVYKTHEVQIRQKL